MEDWRYFCLLLFNLAPICISLLEKMLVEILGHAVWRFWEHGEMCVWGSALIGLDDWSSLLSMAMLRRKRRKKAVMMHCVNTALMVPLLWTEWGHQQGLLLLTTEVLLTLYPNDVVTAAQTSSSAQDYEFISNSIMYFQ